MYLFRHHRSFSGKHGKPRDDPVKTRIRSVSSSVQPDHPYKRSVSQASSKAELHVKSSATTASEAAEVTSLRSDVSKYTFARTESLISDVLSFYSLDGTEPNAGTTSGT